MPNHSCKIRDAPILVDGPGFRADFPGLKLLGMERLDDRVLLKWHILRP